MTGRQTVLSPRRRDVGKSDGGDAMSTNDTEFQTKDRNSILTKRARKKGACESGNSQKTVTCEGPVGKGQGLG